MPAPLGLAQMINIMSDEKFNITPVGNELTIMHQQLLPQKNLLGFSINGTIDAISRFCEIRDFEELDSYVLVNREKMTMTLFIEKSRQYEDPKTIVAELSTTDEFDKWLINSGQYVPCKDLANMIKMNRSDFESIDAAMSLSVELQNIKIKIDKEVEKCDDNRATVKELTAQRVIDSNIPKGFCLILRIFKGQEKVSFNVELYVHPQSFNVALISPEANDIIHSTLDGIIDAEIKKIKELKPRLVIIEE